MNLTRNTDHIQSLAVGLHSMQGGISGEYDQENENMYITNEGDKK